MSIGTLGSAGDQFRDFLGGAQQDIGVGLQAILSNYASPNGNFLRLNNRALNMFELTSSEYQATFDRDAQNSFAETWYSEYRAVLLLRAEALKKKLNRAYGRVLENSIYAPVRPNEEWAPNANRDFNDISASDPLQFYQGAVIATPPIPVPPDTTKYVHNDWFSGSSKKSGGATNAYDDIRSYINQKYPLGDMDGDGNVITWDPDDDPSTDPFDGEYDISSEGNLSAAALANYYNLWDSGLGGANTPYDLETVTTANAHWKDITINMNVPPSTSTQNFVSAGSTTTNYYIEIPVGMTSQSASVLPLLPTFVQDLDDGTGKFTTANKNTLQVSYGVPAGFFKETSVGSGIWYLDAGTRFFDRKAMNQALFPGTASPLGDEDGVVAGLDMNTNLVGPGGSGATLSQNDATSTPSASIKNYQTGFVDSWYEARAMQKREAQIEAAYTAYLDGKFDIDATATAKGTKTWSYEKIMDQVFTAIDGLSPGGAGAPLPPGGGTPGPVAPNLPANVNPMNALMPYGYYLFPGSPTPKHTPENAAANYKVGSAFAGDTGATGGDNATDPGSVYRLIYDRLALAADPTQITGGNSGTAALNNYPKTPNTVPSSWAPAQPTVPNTSNLYSPIPVGASEGREGGSATQPNINSVSGTNELDDTTHLAPSHAATLANISNLFVGRQWDYSPGVDINAGYATVSGSSTIAPVKYEAETISSHLMVLPGWWYDASTMASPSNPVGKALLTMSPPIESLAWQNAANAGGLGRVDDTVNFLLGGPFFHVGGGSDSLGIYDIDGTSTEYSVGVGFGMGIGGIYWGHTSAIGTIGRLDELLDNSGQDANKPDNRSGGWAYQTMKTSLGVLAGIGGEPVDAFSLFPNVGLAGFHMDLNIPIPIPPPVGLSWLNVPMTTYGAASYDILTHILNEYLDNMKHEVIDSISAYSYATSGGYAMDSYGMRGEYHFTEKTAFESIKKAPDLLGLVNVGSIIEQAVGLLGLSNYTINNYDLKEEGIFKGDQMHSTNAAEARELDTGAFFTTAAFMTQFQARNLEYSYWTGTHQNEEVANMDTLRLVSLTGKELMKILAKTVFGLAGRIDWDGPGAAIMLTVLNFMLSGFQQGVNDAVMWDILMHDMDEEGFVTTDKITSSSIKSEGYDFIEDERKLFAYDYEQTTKKGIIQTAVTSAFGSFELPNQVMAGTANTRRYKPYFQGVDGRAGRQGFGTLNGADGTKAHQLLRHKQQVGVATNGTANTFEINGLSFNVGDSVQVVETLPATVGTGTVDSFTTATLYNMGDIITVMEGPSAPGTPRDVTISGISGPVAGVYTYDFTSIPPLTYPVLNSSQAAGPGTVRTVTISAKNGDLYTFGPPSLVNPVRKGTPVIGSGNPNKYDDNWDIKMGFWQDSGLGDINEVYVRKNTVTHNNTITEGLSGTGAPGATTVRTTIDRYVGSHNRLVGRAYDPANPLNLQSFRTGYFADRYFGSYIAEGAATNDMIVNPVNGLVDGRTVEVRMHGGEKYYDRKDDYQFKVTALDGTNINMRREAALAPVLGGRMKIASIDQDDPLQDFGAATQGQTNALTDMLYNHLRVNAAGTNAQLVREYRDAFNMGLLDDMFITSSANAPTGGGVTSSIRIKFQNMSNAAGATLNHGAYQLGKDAEIGGTKYDNDDAGTGLDPLVVDPGYLGRRSIFKNTNRTIADVYLSSFFAFKRQPKTQAK